MIRIGRLLASVVLLGLCASPAAGMTLEEFIGQFQGLAGQEEKADEILRLCDAALAGDARDNPRYTATALGYRSHALFLKKDLKGAEALALEAISADPTSALAHFIHTDVLYELGRLEEARTSCLKATDLMEFEDQKDNLRQLCESSYTFRKDKATQEQARQTDGKKTEE